MKSTRVWICGQNVGKMKYKKIKPIQEAFHMTPDVVQKRIRTAGLQTSHKTSPRIEIDEMNEIDILDT